MSSPYTYRFDTPGWATFGLALPESDDAFTVQLGALQTQFDIKNRWGQDPDAAPDESLPVRFGVVTVHVPAAGTYALTVDDVPPLLLSSRRRRPVRFEAPVVTVRYRLAGVDYTSTLPATLAGFEPTFWLEGALVTEGRAVVVPTGSAGAHPFLQTVFDVRVFADGGYRLDVQGWNCKDVASADQVTYDLEITINGQSVYSKPGAVHMYMKRWRKVFSVGHTEAAIVPDFESFYLAGRFDRFLPGVVTASYNATGPTFDILQNGDTVGAMLASMGQPGGRPELGPYPAWAVQYLVHKTQNLRTYLLTNGDLAGSWSGHITEPDGTSIVRLDKGDPNRRPGYWLDYRWAASGLDGPKNNARGTGYRVDATHQYALYQIPYSVTGDRWYLDGIKGWAASMILMTYTGACISPVPVSPPIDFGRQLGEGRLAPYANEPRGFAWGMREIADAAEACPDTDPDKAYFETKLAATLNWSDWYAHHCPGGFLPATFDEDTPPGHVPMTGREVSADVETSTAYGLLAPFHLYYLTWSHDNARRKGYGPTRAFRDRINTFAVTVMTPPMDPVVGMSLYYPPAGIIAGGYTRFANINEFMAHLPPSSGYVIGYYGTDIRMALLQAVRDGLPGAQAALDKVLAYRQPGSGTSVEDDACYRSQYAITYDASDTPEPPDGGGTPAPFDITLRIRTASETDPNHADNTSTLRITPRAAPPPAEKVASQAIVLTADTLTPVVGGLLHLHGQWSNAGPDAGTNNTAEVLWPATGLTYQSHTVSQGSYDPANRVWTVGTVAVGAVPVIDILGKVDGA